MIANHRNMDRKTESRGGRFSGISNFFNGARKSSATSNREEGSSSPSSSCDSWSSPPCSSNTGKPRELAPLKGGKGKHSDTENSNADGTQFLHISNSDGRLSSLADSSSSPKRTERISVEESPLSCKGSRNTDGLLRREKEKRSSLQDKQIDGAVSRQDSLSTTRQSCPTKGHSDWNHTGIQPENSKIEQEEEKERNWKYSDAFSLRSDWRAAKTSGDYKNLLMFLTYTFDSFNNINNVFLKKQARSDGQVESGIDYDFVRITYDVMLSMPADVQKTVLKSVINSLLQDMKRQRSKDDLRAYSVLLQNPQFDNASTYVIFAHLLRQVSSLNDQEHQFLVLWFRKFPLRSYKALVTRLNQFISMRLFPKKNVELPPDEKCSWWIPSAVKVMALVYAANWLDMPPLVPHVFFYSDALDHIDHMAEYALWQNSTNNPGKFSFCQYPFLLSIAAKRFILQKDSESQMIVMARKSLVEKVQRREMLDMGMLFMNIKVRRLHLITDSLDEIAHKQRDLKKKLKVTFAGEPGLDMGGLTKEWFQLIIRKIFRQEYGMFVYNDKSRYFWFSNSCTDQDQEFNLVGVLMGLAVYNSIILDIHFPPCCYKKLLSPAVVPYHDPHAPVGLCKLGLKDFIEVMPDLGKGLKQLLEYEGNVEEDLCQTFQISYTHVGQVITHSLKPHGEKIPVTNENRQEYVDLYIDYMLNKSIYQQFASFYHGFHSVCASNALILLRPEEVDMLVCGNPVLDMEGLRKVTVYDGYSKNDPTVRYFWEIVLASSLELKKKLLLFATGSDRIPIGGMSEMEFKIIKMDIKNSTDMLPMAHTCFNQLILPPYKSRKILKNKLTIAISNAEGFGIE